MKNIYPNKRIIFTIVIGVLFLLGIINYNWLYGKFWIFAGVFFLPVIILQILMILLNFKRNRIAFSISVSFFVIAFGILIFTSTELFKSQILVKAFLVDDLSAIELKLRANNSFELQPITYLGSFELFKGRYKIENEKLIFIDRPYDSYFIPDTVYFVDKKIILHFNSDGKPDTSFANFFRIDNNKLQISNSKVKP